MAVKEQIGIYQQGEKTTVVIYHMKESTKQKLIQALFADVKTAVEEGQIQEINDLSPSVPELKEQEASVDGMESLAVKKLCEKYGKDAMRLFIQLFQLFDTAPLADREAASAEIAKRLKNNAQTGGRNAKLWILFQFGGRKEFSPTLEKVIRQKGHGMNLDPATEEYRDALKNAMMTCSEEEISAVMQKIAEQFDV